MTYTRIDPQLGPKQYRCHNFRAVRALLWAEAAEGRNIIVIEEAS